jgi:transcriptional regulator with XRE-family HTH domain
MLLRHAIGHVLRRRRLERGLTLRELAHVSRVSVPYLSEIERGRKEVSSEILATVCHVLDVPLGGLLGEVSRELSRADGVRSGEREVVSISSRTSVADAPDAPDSLAGASAPRAEVMAGLLLAA